MPLTKITTGAQAEATFRALLDLAPDAMVIVGPDGRIQLVNRRTEELFKQDRAQLLGQTVEVLVPERFRAVHVPHRERYFGHPNVRPMGAGLTLYGLRGDGSEFPVEISLSPVETESGVLIAAAIRDVTDRKRAEDQLQEALARERAAADQLRELDRLKDEFLSVVSHELRTPLTSIAGFAEVLVERPDIDPATRASILERVLANAVEMRRMVEQLLDYSRLEAGRVEVATEVVALAPAVAHACTSVEAVLSEHRLVVDVDTAIRVVADPHAVDRILGNFLTNASKFSPRGSAVTVTAEQTGGWVTVSVADEGSGVAPADRERIFERFYQSPTNTPAVSRRGTGIGLSIAKRYAELQGGSVGVESAPGAGAIFFVRLPAP